MRAEGVETRHHDITAAGLGVRRIHRARQADRTLLRLTHASLLGMCAWLSNYACYNYMISFYLSFISL